MDASVILLSVPRSDRVPPLILRLITTWRAALGGVVVRRHVRFGHEDEEFLDVALDAPAQPALQS